MSATTPNLQSSGAARDLRRPRRKMHIPNEGDNNLYTQTWYPICFSSDVASGNVIGKQFLGGKVIVFRDENGVAVVMSGFCLHLGADLSNATVVDGQVRCPFHHWSYDNEGVCRSTGSGDPVPSRTRLFRFPTCEMYGLVWAFNGDEPLFQLKQLVPYEDDELLFSVQLDPRDWRIDPWIIRANTPDWQHLKFVHNMEFNWDRVTEAFEWFDFGCRVELDVQMRDWNMETFHYDMMIQGTNIWTDTGSFRDRWHFTLSALTVPAPGRSIHYFANAIHKGNGSDAEEREARQHLADLEEIFALIVSQDDVPLDNLHYAPGLLTKSDQALSRYLSYIKDYPRANPAADFIT